MVSVLFLFCNVNAEIPKKVNSEEIQTKKGKKQISEVQIINLDS